MTWNCLCVYAANNCHCYNCYLTDTCKEEASFDMNGYCLNFSKLLPSPQLKFFLLHFMVICLPLSCPFILQCFSHMSAQSAHKCVYGAHFHIIMHAWRKKKCIYVHRCDNIMMLMLSPSLFLRFYKILYAASSWKLFFYFLTRMLAEKNERKWMKYLNDF